MDETQKQLLRDLILAILNDDVETAEAKFKEYSELKSQDIINAPDADGDAVPDAGGDGSVPGVPGEDPGVAHVKEDDFEFDLDENAALLDDDIRAAVEDAKTSFGEDGVSPAVVYLSLKTTDPSITYGISKEEILARISKILTGEITEEDPEGTEEPEQSDATQQVGKNDFDLNSVTLD